MKYNKYKKILSRSFIFPYVCIFIVPILMWFFSNMIVVNKNNEQVLSMAEDSLIHSISAMERDLNRIESLVYSIGFSPELKSFFASEEKKITHIQMKESQTVLSSYNISNLPIKSMCIYNGNNEALIDTDASYRNSLQYYKLRCVPCEISPEEHVKNLAEGVWEEGFGVSSQYIYDGKEQSLLPYIRTVPFERSHERKANITVFIDVEKLMSSITDFLEARGGFMAIFDDKGRVIMEKEGASEDMAALSVTQEAGWSTYKSDSGKNYRFSYKSTDTGYSYVIFVPQKQIHADTRFFGIFLNFLSIISLIFAVIFSIYFASGRKRMYNEIKEILNVGEETESDVNMAKKELDFYGDSIKKLVAEKKIMSDKLTNVSKYDEERLIYMLFSGYFTDEKEAVEAVENSSFEVCGRQHVVVSICLNESDSFMIEELVENISQFFGENVHIYTPNKDNLALLFSFDDEETAFLNKLKEKVKLYHTDLFKYHTVYLGIGDVQKKYCGITDSYYLAKQVVAYNKLMGNRILFSAELPDENDEYIYPLNVENRLVDSIFQGNEKAAKNILDRIYRENIVEKNLSLHNVEELIKSIYVTLMKIQSTSYFNNKYEKFSFKNYSLNSFFDYAASFIEYACALSNKNTENSLKTKIDEVVEYVIENYANPDLSLQDISSRFNLSTTYISKQFKKNMGISFYVFLESYRIEKACEMLCNEKCTIKDVATHTGYINDDTFRRAFKKKKGVSPLTYVKMVFETENE